MKTRSGASLTAVLLMVAALVCQADQIGASLVQNPGFEDGVDGWDERGEPITLDDQVRFTGQFSCRVVGHAELQYPDFHWVKSADIPAEPNRSYLFEIMVRASVQEGAVSPQVREVDAEGNTVRYHAAETLSVGEHDWHQASTRFVTSTAAANLQVYLVMRTCLGTAW